MSRLSILSVVLGLGFGLPHAYGILKPRAYAAAVRRFPRSTPWGFALMLLGTAWFVYNVTQENIADFAAFKHYLLMGFAAVGIGACVFVRDFLAVRGLAVVLLLLGKLMVDTGRPYLQQTGWVLLIQALAYVFVLAGMWLTISPWRLRDVIEWDVATESRTKMVSGVCLAFGLLIALLGLVKF